LDKHSQTEVTIGVQNTAVSPAKQKCPFLTIIAIPDKILSKQSLPKITFYVSHSRSIITIQLTHQKVQF